MSCAARCAIFVSLVAVSFSASAQNQPPAPNSDPTYQQLRNLGLSTESVTVNNFDLKRDAATFHLQSGTVCFTPPIQGKVTGAVFVGDGSMTLKPPISIENKTLRLLTKENEFNEKFNKLVLRFTDSTYVEIKQNGVAGTQACDGAALKDSQNALRHNHILKYNLDGRILQDVLGSESGGLFVAFIHGQRYNDKEVYAIDPHGVPPLVGSVTPEEVELATYADNKAGAWAAFHLSSEYAAGKASGAQENSAIHIDHQQLETTIEKNANLIGKATTTFTSKVNGLRVVPFDLYRKLRVQSVTTEGGEQLAFIQEDKNDDADFFVVLSKPLSAGEKFVLTTSYSGKEAVSNEGGGNYFPIARDDWFPNNASFSQGAYASYDMTFRIPKGMQITATGSLVSEDNSSGQNVTVWKSEVPQTVAGFNFGRFKMQEAKLSKPEYIVQSYANENPPDWVKNFQNETRGLDLPTMDVQPDGPEAAVGNMSTVPLLKKALAEGELSMQLYTDYFGPLPYKRLAVTQQTACNFGQSWPTLVWLPICSFFDTTVRHALGVDFGDRGYWKIVAPHEVAHQWWGNAVGFDSYRDQWMSEGFAEMSAALFIQLIEKNPKKLNEFWSDQRTSLLERNKEGFRAIDAGPVTLGYRLDNSRTGGNITESLIYPKGAFILHMIRMMMWDRQTGDQNFKQTMQDFFRTYNGKAATTEDFKAMVEKHMTPAMQSIAGDKSSMDWFFNEYVYGTALPSYALNYSFDNGADGKPVFNFKLTQSGVDDSFRMLVPIYFELQDGRVAFLGRVNMMGNNTVSQQVPMGALTEKPKRAVINLRDDVLASPN